MAINSVSAAAARYVGRPLHQVVATVEDPELLQGHGRATLQLRAYPVVTIESVKAASDITAPLDGQITEVNTVIVENPALVNEDPLGDGWFFKLKPEDMSALDDMMDEDAYLKYIG